MSGHNPLNAELEARDSVKQGGIWKDISLPFPHCLTTAGQILTGATTPLITTSSTRPVVRWAAGDAAAVVLTFDIPADYDEFSDALEIRLKLAKSTAGNAADTTIAAAAYITRATLALPSSVAAARTPLISDETTPSILILPFTRNNDGYASVAKTRQFKANDTLSVTLTPSAHATAVIDLFGIRVRYKGGLSMYNAEDRNSYGNSTAAVLSYSNGTGGTSSTSSESGAVGGDTKPTS